MLYTDDDIVRLCQQGRQEISLLLPSVSGQGIKSCVQLFATTAENALDATQDVFLRVLPAIKRFRSGSPLWPWLRRITTNTCLNRLRAAASRPEMLAWDGAAPELEVAMTDRTGNAAAELAWIEISSSRPWQLPAIQRIVVVLRHEEDLTYEQIADVTQLPLGTVKTHLFRARRKLRGNGS